MRFAKPTLTMIISITIRVQTKTELVPLCSSILSTLQGKLKNFIYFQSIHICTDGGAVAYASVPDILHLPEHHNDPILQFTIFPPTKQAYTESDFMLHGMYGNTAMNIQSRLSAPEDFPDKLAIAFEGIFNKILQLRLLLTQFPVYNDFRKPGAKLVDIFGGPDPKDLCNLMIEQLYMRSITPFNYSGLTIAGLEPRGLGLGMALAAAMNVPFVPIRKDGNLPGAIVSQDYAKEHGNTDTLYMQDVRSLAGHWRCLIIVDSVIATGRRMLAAKQLMEKCKNSDNRIVLFLAITEIAASHNVWKKTLADCNVAICLPALEPRL